MEGVMMRGASTWAVSVRTPDGAIKTEVAEAPEWAKRWARVPLARGRGHPGRVDVARHPGVREPTLDQLEVATSLKAVLSPAELEAVEARSA
jgi:uncharacterized protein YqhQ